MIQRAVLHEDPELVPSEPRKGVPFANLGLELHAELAQQLVTGDMTAGVVDHLELVQVQVTHHVLAVSAAGRFQHVVQSLFEGATVQQSRKGVVGRLISELL